MKTILVPLDGTPFAEQILPYVRLLAPAFGARVYVLGGVTEDQQERLIAHSHPIDAALLPPPPVCEMCTLTARCQHTDCYQAEQAELLRADGVEAYGDTRVGSPAAVIAASAAQWPDTLIAMATHAHGGLRRWMLGSVTDRVVHDTTIPLLLARGMDEAPPSERVCTRILVPLDGSAFANQALPHAIELAARLHAELTLLWVVAPSIEEYMRGFPPEADLQRLVREQLIKAYASFGCDTSTERVPLTTAISLGPAAETIAEEAERRRAGLIVMATHGYTGLQRWRLGSVADTLLHLTPTPLLLVRGQAGANSTAS